MARNMFRDENDEAIQTVEAIALLTDRSPAELLQAAYDGPEEGFDLDCHVKQEIKKPCMYQ